MKKHIYLRYPWPSD